MLDERLGAWAPYLAEPEMFGGWYWLHAELQHEYDHFVAQGSDMRELDQSQWARVHDSAIYYANKSVEQFQNSYHNNEHFRVTEENGIAAIEQFERLTGKTVPGAVRQALALALRLHDCHHCGSAFRTDALRPELVHLPELGMEVSQEWVSAIAVNRWGLMHYLPMPWRLFMTMIIWASTFGGTTPKGQTFDIPNPKPTLLWGNVMRAADVCPPEDFEDALRHSISVLYGELPAAPAAETLHGYLEAQLGFYGYVGHCFDELDRAAGVSLAEALGWRDRLAGHCNTMAAMQAGSRPELVELVRSEAAKYGIILR